MTDLARRAALEGVLAVLGRKESLLRTLPSLLASLPAAQDRAFTQSLVLGTVRFEPRLSALLSMMLDKPLKRGDLAVQACLLLGLYQLIYLETPPHAAVSESVSLVPRHLPWARGLVNGVLRKFTRESRGLLAAVDRHRDARLAHPGWLLDALQRSWGDDYETIAQANNLPGQLTIRINEHVGTREGWKKHAEAAGIKVTDSVFASNGLALDKAGDPGLLPGFNQGAFAVQDGAAQLAAPLLAPEHHHRILDACAAPGGKTGHIAEIAADAQVTALEMDAGRTARMRENLARLGHEVEIVVGDACEPASWWNGERFDRILLDVPCSATGIIRRHPDIKLLRGASDMGPLIDTQAKMLRALWPTLAAGGRLLYATCSVLREENHEQITAFLAQQSDAEHVPIDASWGRAMPAGRQILPGEAGMDGFYYALLQKQ